MKNIIASLAFLLSLSGFSQNSLSDRIVFGGGGGFNSSSSQTNISLLPQVGYRVTDRYIAGIGITYQYVNFKSPIDKSLSNYGWSLWNRYQVFRQFFAYGEFERLTFEYFTDLGFEQTDRKGYSSLLLGAGVSEQLGGRASLNFTALYNVLYDASDPIQPYNSPWVLRAGVGVGLF